jgi:ribosomal protein L11 methyltransferase
VSRWFELRAVVPRVRMDRLSQLAFAHGASGVQEDAAPGHPVRYRQPWDTEDPPLPMLCMFKAWFAEETLAAARDALGAEVDHLEQLPVDETDWAESWKLHHHRIVVSDRLAVAPPWDAVPGDLVIPPGQAFGTGSHPTTLACLGAIDRLADDCQRCLDVGCGSGILALAATRLGLQSEGIDIEEESVRASMENAATNGLSARFSATPLEDVRGTYDLVVANLYAEVLTQLAPDLLRVTSRHLVLAGILADRAGPLLEILSPPLAVRAEVREGDWLHLHLERL